MYTRQWAAQNSWCSRLHCLLNQQGKTSNINPPSPTVSLETKKKEEKKWVEGSVSLTFIMIKEKPVYPYNTLSLKHSGPPRQPPSPPLSPANLAPWAPSSPSATSERRHTRRAKMSRAINPPKEHPTLYFVLSFSLFTGRFHQGLLRQAVTLQAFFSVRLRDAACDRSAVWMRPKCDGGNVSVKVAEESQGRCYRMFQVCLSNYILLF